MDYLKTKRPSLRHIIVMPIVSSLIIPLVILDIWVEFYHRLCFPLCKISFVKRSKYIIIDRHKLKYLNLLQKIFCVYCGYGNGVINYWKEIAGRTEKYWCGIKHKRNRKVIQQYHQKKLKFAKYNNEKDFKKKYMRK